MGFPRHLLPLLSLATILAFLAPSIQAQEITPPENEKATRYFRLLQKKPGNTTLFNRFVGAWLDTDSSANLVKWLQQSTTDETPATWQILASLHDYLGDDPSALTALNEAVKAAPKNTPLRLTRAKLKARLLDFESALLDLQPALDAPKLGIEASKLQGSYLARAGRIEEALTAWQNLVKKHPLDEELREDLIEAQVAEGLTKEAAETATKLVAMTRDPYQKALRQLRLGDLQIKSEDRESGLKTYTALIATTGADTWLEREVLAQIERVFLREDDLIGLLTFLENLQKKHPRRVSIRKALARQLAATGKTDKAISLFREILRITPGDLGNREEFITFLEASEKWQLAREELNHLIKQNPNDHSLWQNLLRLETTLKNKSGITKALAEIRKLRATTPDGFITVANLFQQADLPQETEKLLREGKEKFPASDEITETLAAFLVTHNQQAEALALWQKLADGTPRESLLRIARSMSSHDKNEEAFNLLLTRLSDFENDPLYLGQICNLATSPDTQTRAIPLGKSLIELATTATDLENAIRLTQRLIIQSKQVEQALALEPKTRGQKCLHASLAAHLGDSPRALKFLDEAEALDPTQLTQFFRLRFEEKFGTIDRAIALLRSLITTPAGRKTVHLRRLVNLLEQNGDWPAALAAVIEWKKIAPGDQAAWKRKADLHLKLNEPEKAVTELRRLIGRIDATPDHQILLAEALLENDEPRPARQIYQRLYQDSDDLNSKLKWLTPLVRIADQDDHLPELLADFERRKRNNPTSVAPLLALAEIHRLNRNDEQRRSALLEAIRRRPNDLPLLLGIAAEEERFGEVSRAISILREALQNDSGHLIKRRLAMLHLRLGEIQTGLRLLNEIPGEKNDPRQIETTVIALIASRDLTAARKHLQSHLAQHRDDWRLRYLQGILCDFDQDFQKGITIFSELQKTARQIPGLPPLLGPHIHKSQSQTSIPLPGTPPGWQELNFLHDLIKEDHSKLIDVLQGKPHHGSLASLIRLPGNPREARLMATLAIAKTARTLDRNSPIRQATLDQLTLLDVPAFSLFKSLELTRKNQLAILESELNKHPDSLFHLRHWLEAKFEEPTEFDPSKIRQAFLKIARSNPKAAAFTLYRIGYDGSLPSSETPLILNLIFEETQAKDLPTLLTYLVTIESLLEYQSQEVTAKISDHIFTHVQRLESVPKDFSWLPGLLIHYLNTGDPEKTITLFNLSSQYSAKNFSPLSSRLHRLVFPQADALAPPPFPPLCFPNLPLLIGLHLSEQLDFDLNPETKKRHEILTKLSPEHATDLLAGPLEFLRGHEGKINDPYLRDLVTASLSRKKALPEIAAKFAAEKDHKHAGRLLFAAGYFFKKGEVRKSYELLLRAHRLPLSLELRNQVAGSLVHLGAILKARKTPGFDPAPAVNAAMALRRHLNGEDRDSLSRHLVALGAIEASKSKSNNSRTSPFRKRRPSRSSKQTPLSRLPGMGGVMGNLILKDRDSALREASKIIRAELRGNNNEVSDNMSAQLQSLGLAEDLLKIIAPPEEAPRMRQFEHARLALQMGQPALAREALQNLLAKNPDDPEARANLLILTPLKEWKKEKIDPKTLEELTNLVAHDLETILHLCALTTDYLEKLKPEITEDRNLRWTVAFLRRASRQEEFGLTRLTPMHRPPQSYYAADSEAETRRNQSVLRLIQAMLAHPDILNRTFSDLVDCREALGLSDEDLSEIARPAFLKLAQTTFPNGSGPILTDRRRRQPIANHLLAQNDTEFLFAEKTLTALRQGQPGDAATLAIVRDLAKGTPKEALAAYRKWEENLPEDPEKLGLEFDRFIHLVLHLQPPAASWTSDFQKRFLSLAEKIEFFESYEIYGKWAAYLGATMGPEKTTDFLTALFELHLGESENWHLFNEIDFHDLPSELRDKLTVYSVIAGDIVHRDKGPLATSVTLFVEDANLSQPFESSATRLLWSEIFHRDLLLSLATEGSSEEIAEGIRRTEILKNDPADLTTRALLVMRTDFSPNDPEADWQAPLQKLLELQEGNHPALEAILIAQLLPAEKAGPLVSEIVEKHPDLIQACRERSPDELEQFLKRHPDAGGSPANLVLREIQNERDQKVRQRIAPWLQDGIPLGHPEQGGYLIWQELARLADFDPELAARLTEETFRQLKDWPKARESSISPTAQPAVFETWMISFFEHLLEPSEEDSLPGRIVVTDRLIRGPTMGFLDPPLIDSRVLSDPFGDSFMDLLRSDRDTLISQFSTWSEDLTAEQEVTLIALLSPLITIRSVNEAEEFLEIADRVDKELRAKSPAFADGLIIKCLAQGYRKFDNSTKDVARARLQKSYRNLLRKLDGLPLATRLHLTANLLEATPSIVTVFENEDFAKRTLTELQEYLKSPRQHSHWLVVRLMTGLLRAESSTQPEQAAKLIDLVKSQPRLKLVFTLSSILLRPALAAKRGEFVEKLVVDAFSKYQGDAFLMLELAEAGMPDLAKHLIPSTATGYRISPRAAFQNNWPEKMSQLLPLVPKNHRFTLEVTLSNCPDAPGKNAPPTDRATRLTKLAKKAVNQLPEDRRERLHLLRVLSEVTPAAQILHEAMEAEIAHLDLEMMRIIHREGKIQGISFELFTLASRTIRLDLAAGKTTRPLQHFASLMEAARYHGSTRTTVARREFLEKAQPIILARAARGKKEAQEMAEFSRTILNLNFRIDPTDLDLLFATLDLIHATHKEEDWKKHLQKLPPERQRWLPKEGP